MDKFKIEMTEDEMIIYYANKIVEDGIKNSYKFSNIVDINDYGDIAKYKIEKHLVNNAYINIRDLINQFVE